MRQARTIIAIIAILAIGVAPIWFASGTPIVRAKTGTTIASQQTNVTVDVLGRGPSSIAPAHGFQLLRLTIPPGGRIASPAQPGDTVFSVESGTLRWTTEAGTPLLIRGERGGNDVATTARSEALKVGAMLTLQPGNAVFVDQRVQFAAGNGGDSDAIMLCARLSLTNPLITSWITSVVPPFPATWIGAQQADGALSSGTPAG
jgi:hypothetical protein